MTIEIETVGPPKLDWLTPEVARYVLQLESPIDNTTQNVHLIERLVVPANGLSPSALRRAASLEWLLLRAQEPVTSEWFAELREVVATSLPSLVLIEMQGRQIGSRRPLFSARAGDEALALFDRLIASPSLLEE